MMGIVVLIVHGRCKEGLPIAQGEEEFLVVLARVVAVFDVDEAELARVRALVQVIHSHGVRVIPSASGWTWREFEAPPSMRLYDRRALLLRAVHLGRDEHAMPMNKLRCIRVVDDVNSDPSPGPHSKEGAGCGAVIPGGRENVG